MGNDINIATNNLFDELKGKLDGEQYSVGSTCAQAINGKQYKGAQLIVTMKRKTNTDKLPDLFMGYEVVYIVGEP